MTSTPIAMSSLDRPCAPGLAWRLLLLVWALVASPARGADPIPAEAFFRRPAVLDLQLSPSGRHLALTTEAKGRVGLFVIDLQAPDSKAKGAALFDDGDVRRFRWVDDERLVFDVVDLQAGLGQAQREAPGLFAVHRDGADLRMLIERQPRRVVPLSPRVGALPLNHILLQVPTVTGASGARTGEIIVGELQGQGRELYEMAPMWLNTRTGRTRPLDTADAPANPVHWWFTPQGQPRAVLTRKDDREALHWFERARDGQPGRWIQLAEGPRHHLPFLPVWVGADDTLLVVHARGPAGERVLSSFDFASGRPGTPWIVVPGFDFAGQLITTDDGLRLAGARVDADAEQAVWLDPAMRSLQAAVDALLPGRVNRMSCRRCDAADAVVVVHSSSDRQPGQLLLRLPAGADGKPRWRLISTLLPGIDADRMAAVELVSVTARDGLRLPVWLTRPAAGPADAPRPAVVLVHGGPWVRQGHWRWEPMAQFLASRGYVVIEPEFRGSAGYGLVHERAGDKQFGQAMQDDVTDALRWAQSQKIASDKACIAGADYGGYATLMGLIREPELFRCGSAWFAIADLMLFVDGAWYVQDDIPGSLRQSLLAERVGDPVKDRAMLLANSPVEQAHRIRAPLQLIWGSDDKRVPINHGTRLRSAMRKAGQEPEWIEYEGEAHGLRKTENRVDMALKLEAFLARHLK